MMPEVDEEFYDRADAHILLANDAISETVGRGKDQLLASLCGEPV